jgi:2-keto-3-deoxy-L-rhamnonate aldolase RhmA
MQHSTMSWDDVARMIAACPRVGAAPMIRMPDALESSMQKATDMGVLGVIIPTVDDAIEARDAARFARYPPVGRRSSGGGQYSQIWNAPGINYRTQVNDNMLVVVMIETLEGVANADEIASTYGVDVVILGNNDLSSFSGWAQTDPRYQDAITTVHNATLKAGKFYGNAGEQYLTGNRLSPATRFVQDGPARDGWTVPASLRRPATTGAAQPTSAPPPPHEEPLIGLPAGR